MSENGDDHDQDPNPEAGGKLLKWLNGVYNQVVAGRFGIPGVEDSGPPPANSAEAEREITKAIRYATIEAGAVGFLTSVGGVITLPVSLPAGVAGTLVIQMRMLARIAHL